MSARNLLQPGQALGMRLNALLAQQRHLSRLAATNPRGAFARRGVALEGDIVVLYRQMDRLNARVRALVDRLPNPAQRDILMMRYQTHMTFDDIAGALNYSARQVYRLHAAGLAGLDALLSAPDKKDKAG